MPVDTFTGLVLGYSATGMTGMMSRSWGPSPVEDVHLGGAVMWIGGDAIMLVLIMTVFLAWSRDDRGTAGGLGWLDTVRQARLASLGAAAATSTRSVPVAAAGTGAAGTGAALTGTDAGQGGAASVTSAGANAAPIVAAGPSVAEGSNVAERFSVEVEQAASHDGTGRPSAGRPGDVDEDDEQLAAYNAYLAKLREAESGSGRPRRF